MNKIFKIAAAAALALGLFTASASAQDASLYDDSIIVTPASYSTADQSNASAYQAIKRGKIVAFNTSKAKGSIIISTKSNELYYVLGSGKAVKYRVATARKGFEWAGTHKVSSKTQWPDWRPPAEMRARHPELPVFMAGGPKNPLGARAMYLGSSIYRIHGTNEPKSIGKSASSGCIRMLNEDVTELYRLVKIGAEVTVI
jgi:lipoprotein-anchoring transpeptidase ErfK/SrfK